MREVVTLAVASHPNIVAVLGYCWTPIVCLVMEFCRNGTLADLLSGNEGLTLTWMQTRGIKWVDMLGSSACALAGVERTPRPSPTPRSTLPS